MRVVVVGMGVQGHKRRRVAGADFVATVDPVHAEADYSDIADVPLDRYDAVLSACPTSRRSSSCAICSATASTCWSRSRCWAPSEQDIVDAARRRRSATGAVCYTAYNHRFEPHYVRMRDLIASGELGEIYSLPHVLRQRHGAAGARFRLARPRRRRAARPRLAPARHLPLLVRRSRRRLPPRRRARVREPRAGPRRDRAARRSQPAHRARDDAADVAQPLHLRHPRREGHRAHRVAVQVGADRPSPSARASCRAAARRRSRSRWCRTIRPGRSNTRTSSSCVESGATTDLSTDLWLHRSARRASARRRSSIEEKTHDHRRRLRRHDASRPRLGDGRRQQGLRDRRLRSAMPRSSADLRSGSCRCSSPTSTISSPPTATA